MVDKKILQQIRNDNARPFDTRDRFHVNEVRFDANSSKEHKTAIMDFFFEHHIEQGHSVLTRAHKDSWIPSERLCCDACCLDCGTIFEAAFSEDDESLERKKKVWEDSGFFYQTKRITD